MIQIVAAALLLLYIIYLFKRWSKKHSINDLLNSKVDVGDKKTIAPTPQCQTHDKSGCAGCMETNCAVQDLLLKHQMAPQYYDDEELDLYAGRSVDTYTSVEVEQFREVLTTLQPQEVEDWLKSLELRSIALPRVLVDEARILISQEKRY